MTTVPVFSVFRIASICLLLVHYSESSCFMAKLVTERTVSDRFLSYCEFKPTATSASDVTIRLLPGSRLYLASDCMDCECRIQGLRCCGFGTNAGVTAPPPAGCKKILDGCQELTVKVNNETLDCETGRPITQIFRRKVHQDNVYSRESEDRRITSAIEQRALRDSPRKTDQSPGATQTEGTTVTKGSFDIPSARTWDHLVPGFAVESSSTNTLPTGTDVVAELIRELLNSRRLNEAAGSLNSVTGTAPTSQHRWHSETVRISPHFQSVQTHQPQNPPMHDFFFPFLFWE